MPAPVSLVSTDRILYDYLYNPLADKLCFLDPNYITGACFLMLIPLVHGLLQRWPLWIMILIIFVRQSLDCLDGAVARKCKKTSKIGALLDLGEDLATFAVLGGVFLWIMWRRRTPIWALTLAFIVYLYGNGELLMHFLDKINDKARPFSQLELLMHDNTVVMFMLVVIGLHKLI